MRQLGALLIAAGLAAAPTSAIAGPTEGSGASPSAAAASSASSPSSPSSIDQFQWSMSKGRLGVLVMGLTPDLRTHFGVAADRGVLVAHVEPGSPAAKAGLVAGDVIIEVRGHAVAQAGDVIGAIADAHKGETVAIAIVRDRRPLALPATLTDDPLGKRFDDVGRELRELMHRFELPAPFDEHGWFWGPDAPQPGHPTALHPTGLRT